MFCLYYSNWMILIALLGTLVVLFPLMIKRHETPTNYILLGAFVSKFTLAAAPVAEWLRPLIFSTLNHSSSHGFGFEPSLGHI